MTLKPFIRPKSIIDPEPTKNTIEQCEINANKFISDDHFHEFILSEINNNYEIDVSSIHDCKIIRPNTVQFQVVLLKIKDNCSKDQEFVKKKLGGSVLGKAICLPLENTFCPLILQYDDSNLTINHEAIHIYQLLKESFYPLDNQLTSIDRKFQKPSLVVPYILNTLGIEKAIEYAVQKPSVILREEAEAWWKVDKNDGAGPESYIISNTLLSLSKFVGAINNDIKLSTKDDQIDDLIKAVGEYINFIGEKDYYCSRIVGLLNRKINKSYSLGKFLTEAASAFLTEARGDAGDFSFDNMEQLIKFMCAQNLPMDQPV